MTRLRLLASSMAVVWASAACSDIGGSECLEDVVVERMAAEEGGGDWRAQVDSVIAAAPADSVIEVVVFVRATSRSEFTAWAERQDVPITYAFHGFSGYLVTPEVSDLTTLKDLPSVTGIDWGIGSLSPACQ